MIDDIYNAKILGFAGNIGRIGRLDHPDATAMAHSKLCGSTVTVDVNMEDGVVTDLRVHTPGGVIGPGAAVMDLVPRQDRLIVTARVRPEDIDVVRPGLEADGNLLSYNQRRVPPLHGTVQHVSADRMLDKRTDQPYYATKIRVQDRQIDGVKIVPGMPAQVFIKTGRGTVALYALKPLLDSFNSAFRED